MQKFILIQGSVCECEPEKYNWLADQAGRTKICLLWVTSVEQTAALYSSALRAFAEKFKPQDEIISISSTSSDSISVISDNI